MAEDSYNTIMESDEMDKLVLEQQWLETDENCAEVLRFCEDSDLRDLLYEELIRYKEFIGENNKKILV